LVGERLEALARFIVRERARSGGWLTFRQRGTALGCFSGHFNTLGFVLILYDLDEILDWDLDV